MANPFSEAATFISEVKGSFHTIGALAPSSRWVARALAKDFARHANSPGAGPVRILEVGAGTGPATAEIVKAMRPGDTLDTVELNERFAEVLAGRFMNEKDFIRVATQCRILAIDFQELPIDTPYDFVVCGLPFNNFSPGLVRALFRKMHQAVASHGTLSFFEYYAIRRMKAVVSKRSERQRLTRVATVLRHYLKQYEFSRDMILLNLVPTVVHHLHGPAANDFDGQKKGQLAQGSRS